MHGRRVSDCFLTKCKLSIDVTRIFDWGQTANHMQRCHQKCLKRGTFYGEKIRRIEDQRAGPGLPSNQDFGKGEDLNQT